jgi:hypothetical protein
MADEKCVVERQRLMKDRRADYLREQRQKAARLAPNGPRRAPWLDKWRKPAKADAEKPAPSPADIVIDECARKHGVKVTMIKGKSRRKELTAVRHEVMYLLRVRLGMSYPKIGAALGGRDHSTVISGIAKHCEKNGIEVER